MHAVSKECRLKKLSYNVALGGLISALSILIMFLTGIIPFGVYAFPAIAGAVLVVIAIESGFKWSLLAYGAVALLSLLITPDIEAKMLFIFFFGYYPTLKAKLESIKLRALEWLTKLLVFNASVIIAYLIIIQIVGFDIVTENLGDFGKWAPLVVLAAANFTFVIYDIALTRVISTYMHFRPQITKRFK